MSFILFLVILAALIFFHELGHFLVAKASGIRVDEFAIGFPPRILSFKYGETVYTINLIPFGGFVKIFGENPDDESVNGPDKSRSFVNKPRYIQAMTLVAGVVFNVLFAWILIGGALMIGLPAAIDHEKDAASQRVKDLRVVVTEVLPNSPAEKADFKSGDSIASIGVEGKTTRAESAEMVQSFIRDNAEKELSFFVKRKDEIITIRARADTGVIDGRPAVGIALGDIGVLRLPPHEALIESAGITYSATKEITKGLFSFILKALTGKADFKEVTGPVGIVGLVGDASDFGLAYLLNFTAFISINLAVINLLPFPALDGGRLLVVAIEGVVRRPLNYKYVNAVNAGGFVLLILLMILVTYQDIARIF